MVFVIISSIKIEWRRFHYVVISVSNIRIEKVFVETDDGVFCIVDLINTKARIMIRKSRVFADRGELEKRLELEWIPKYA